MLKLLFDNEFFAVSAAETDATLSVGDVFIDLNIFDLGVQKSPRSHTPMGHVLPRKAVHPNTWKKIVAQLPSKAA